jgi:hypothetical protein
MRVAGCGMRDTGHGAGEPGTSVPGWGAGHQQLTRSGTENSKPTALPSQGGGGFWAMAGLPGSAGRAATAKPSAWDGRVAWRHGDRRIADSRGSPVRRAGRAATGRIALTPRQRVDWRVAAGTTTFRHAECESSCACGTRPIPVGAPSAEEWEIVCRRGVA